MALTRIVGVRRSGAVLLQAVPVQVALCTVMCLRVLVALVSGPPVPPPVLVGLSRGRGTPARLSHPIEVDNLTQFALSQACRLRGLRR